MKQYTYCKWCGPDDIPEPCCSSLSGDGMLTCTRTGGHPGMHIACGDKEHDLARWPRLEPDSEGILRQVQEDPWKDG